MVNIGNFVVSLSTYVLIKTYIKRLPIPILRKEMGIRIDYILIVLLVEEILVPQKASKLGFLSNNFLRGLNVKRSYSHECFEISGTSR